MLRGLSRFRQSAAVWSEPTRERQACIRAKEGNGGGKWRGLVPMFNLPGLYCIDITTLWSSIWRPRSSGINAERLRCKYRYNSRPLRWLHRNMIDRLMMIFTNTYVKKIIFKSGKHGVNGIVLTIWNVQI